MYRFACPSCARPLQLSEVRTGRQVACPGCGETFPVPAPAPEPAVPHRPQPPAEATGPPAPAPPPTDLPAQPTGPGRELSWAAPLAAPLVVLLALAPAWRGWTPAPAPGLVHVRPAPPLGGGIRVFYPGYRRAADLLDPRSDPAKVRQVAQHLAVDPGGGPPLAAAVRIWAARQGRPADTKAARAACYAECVRALAHWLNRHRAHAQVPGDLLPHLAAHARHREVSAALAGMGPRGLRAVTGRAP